MWKDFFYFSKSQRTGIVTLIILILAALAINFTLPLFFASSETDATEFLKEVEEFKKSLTTYEELSPTGSKHSLNVTENEEYTLFMFNPNTADSIILSKLGLKPRIISNILKYRAKGGKFKTADDFKKIYGLSEEKFLELKPYISIQK